VSDESEDFVPTEEELPEAYVSPLNIMLSEMHEVYQELLLVGFPDRVAALIVANMIQDAMLYRPSDDDDDNNDEQDNINNDDNGAI
jgi:hypothetical protein